MAKYIETQTRKLISSYGGVGSIMESPLGALIVQPFDKWPFYYKMSRGEIEVTPIEDTRLLNRLNFTFKNLTKFVPIPISSSSISNPSKPQDIYDVGKVNYFPTWFYCSKCKRLKSLSEWYNGWRRHYDGKPKEKANTFIPPKCYACFAKAKRDKKKKKFFELEQVRFIMTSPDGKIADFPWDRWNIAEKSSNDESNKENPSRIIIDWDKTCCNAQDLRYHTSKDFADFVGIQISCQNSDCKSKGKKVSLAGLFSLRKYAGKGQDEENNEIKYYFKPVIRTSNSVYYPLITKSIFLPIDKPLSSKIKGQLDLLLGVNTDINIIAKHLNLTIGQINDHTSDSTNLEFIPEETYRLKEYNFLLEKDDFNNHNLIFEHIGLDYQVQYGLSKFISLRKIKMTSVQTGYTRQEPLDNDRFAKESQLFHSINKTPIKAKLTTCKPIDKVTYLPAVESYGEGLFVDLNKNRLDNWFDLNYSNNEEFKRRINSIQHNANQSDFGINDSINTQDSKLLAKFILIHTLSHILIKELEFLVGYPATSLQERLYVNNEDMQGVMIYTISGSEGSYGGLVSQTQPNVFKKIFDSALVRAKDCASDPVCYHSIDGQGIGGLNFAACYSCTLLPETSCENFNSFLDRALLIDEEYGYFKTVI